jgi:hypothetical protein
MKKLWVFIVFFVVGCEVYTTETKTPTLSGKYVVNLIQMYPTDQDVSPNRTYYPSDTFISELPYPFDTLVIGNFFLHFDYSMVMMKRMGVDFGGRDIWEIGPTPYYIRNGTPFYTGDLQFTYEYKKGGNTHWVTSTFTIIDDGYEHLIIQTKGYWPNVEMGENLHTTFTLTRVGP